jgi:predicted nucleotidyltransferase
MIQPNSEPLLARFVEALSRLPGVHAIALGGSRARGAAGAHSDYDIGLYYEPGAPFDVTSLQRVVDGLDDTGRAATLTPIGGWGQWINGGGWLTLAGTRVDLLYRDLQRVRAVIDDCHEGRIERHYQPGHPHAFVSSIYMGEVAYCRPLWDPAGSLAALNQLTQPYPRRLADALVDTLSLGGGVCLAKRPSRARPRGHCVRGGLQLPVHRLSVPSAVRHERCLPAQRKRRRGRDREPCPTA